MAQLMSTFNAAQSPADPRLAAARAWLERFMPGVGQTLVPASADASFRRYFRLQGPAGTLVLMDAPPAQEPIEPFLRVGGWLAQCELHVPAVIAADASQGFVLLEDLGDATSSYHAVLLRTSGRAERLYLDAIKALVRMQRHGRRFQKSLPPYDAALLQREMALFRDWLCEVHLQLVLTQAERAMLDGVFALLCEAALAQPRVFVHRDYHSRNLMVCESRNPGVLDFQDAVEGPITYDLVSLLKDCYLRWPIAERERWTGCYLAEAGAQGLPVGDPDIFGEWLALMGVQRHLKAAGIFARLCHRDHKPGYLADIPLTLAYVLEVTRMTPPLRAFGRFLEARVLPALQARAP